MKTSETIKKMNIKHFREFGYLQELNRQFLHPLGLALEVIQDDDGTERLGGIWDYRNDKEGIYYDIEHSLQERKNNFNIKRDQVNSELRTRSVYRKKLLGFEIEPIKTN